MCVNIRDTIFLETPIAESPALAAGKRKERARGRVNNKNIREQSKDALEPAVRSNGEPSCGEGKWGMV